jgi:hypothetical protein
MRAARAVAVASVSSATIARAIFSPPIVDGSIGLA